LFLTETRSRRLIFIISPEKVLIGTTLNEYGSKNALAKFPEFFYQPIEAFRHLAKRVSE